MKDKNKDVLVHLPSYILRSKYRKDIFFELIKKPFQTQTQLLKETSPKYRAHVSRTIKELLDNKLIECENPNEKVYKLYKPSKIGLKINEEISKYNKIN